MEIQTTLCQDVQSGRQFAVRCGGVAGMRYCLLAILLFFVQTICAQVSHQFRNTPLIDAIRTIEQGQTEYTVSILSDGLTHLTTSARIEEEDALRAIKRLCKGLGVKVKAKNGNINVQAKASLRDMPSHQLILGSVCDAFLKIPLPNARVSLLTADSIIVQDSIKVTLNKKDTERYGTAMFSLQVPNQTNTYLLRATLAGYEDAWQILKVKGGIDYPWGLDSPLELRRILERTLDEVAVTATRLKMFYKGDTLIYDATAFKLPEGSMLDDLIRQMPGVTMNDNGEIFVNGRKVDELLLGSRTFFGGNSKVLLENLPYYTVNKIKVYEMESDRSRALGYDVDPKKYVMDVNLKDEYRNGYIANIEAAGGTQKRWLGRAFLLGFTDRLRFTLLGNANNVNEKRHIGESDSWKPEDMPRSMLTTKSVAAEIDYQSKNGNVKENFMVDFTASKDFGETAQRRELFLDGSMPYSTYKASNTSHAYKLLAKNNLKLSIPNKIYTDIGVDFTYNKYKGNGESISEDFLDSISTRLRSSHYNDGYSYHVGVGGFISPRINNPILRSLVVFYGFNHNEDRNETARAYLTEQFVNTSVQTQYNANDFHHRETNGSIHLTWSKELFKNLRLEIQDRQVFAKRYERDNLYHPDTIALPSQLDALLAITDYRNSYESNYSEYTNTPTVMLKWRKYISGQFYKMEYVSLNLNFTSLISCENLTYTRNNITQHNNRTSYGFMSSINFKILPTKKEREQLSFNIGHEQGNASMFDLLDYMDDSTPQVVKLGNPNLKGNMTTSFNINFNDRESKRRGEQYNIRGDFKYYHRQVAQSVVFNPENSQYTYQPQNVSGAYVASGKFDYNSFLDKQQRWSWQTTFNATYNHSIDHVLQTGMTESTPNSVNTITLSDGIWFQYQKQDFSIRAKGNVSWRHSESQMRDFTTLNSFDYQYGLNARYTIPVLKTTISVDGNMYSRRGYGSDALNTDDFVFNASVSQPFLKGKLIAKVEAFDLFHQLSSTQYVVNAQGRTETWNRTLPNYAMLHLVYHFNKTPKKR